MGLILAAVLTTYFVRIHSFKASALIVLEIRWISRAPVAHSAAMLLEKIVSKFKWIAESRFLLVLLESLFMANFT
jgi:hypothetical protein